MPRPHFTPGSTIVLPVKQRSGKQLLSAYLAARLGVVQPWAEDLIRRGHVKLDEVAATTEQLINLSDGTHAIEVYFPVDWPSHMTPTPMHIDFLHRDDSLVVVNKPPGIVVHPARGHLDRNTLQNGIRHHYRHLLADPDATIGSPHRLDKDTSGAIVFALRREAYVDLVRQFTESKPHKEYLAVVDGQPNFDALVCDSPLGNDPERKGLGTVVPVNDGGKTARTDFTVVERHADWAVLRAVPHTGRPHQIRIHAASLGLPLAGDRDYNPDPQRLGFPRQALHAASLAFTHPEDGRAVRFNAPLTADIAERLETLRKLEKETLQ